MSYILSNLYLGHIEPLSKAFIKHLYVPVNKFIELNRYDR